MTEMAKIGQTFGQARLGFESAEEMRSAAQYIADNTSYTTWEEPEVDALTIFDCEETDLRAFASAFNAGLQVWDFNTEEWQDLE